MNSRNPQSRLDLPDMQKTKSLEGQPSPSRSDGSLGHRLPEMLVRGCAVKKPEMEKRKLVNELIDTVARLLAGRTVPTDKAAALLRFKDLRKCTGDSVAGCGDDLAPRRPDLLARQDGNDPLVEVA